MKILLAEDTADLNKVICAVLAHEGYDVDPAFDGEEAMEHINKEGYDCMILEIMMPKKDGIEVLREVRAKNILTPVIMLTAKSEIDDRVAGLDAGADDYLSKPFAMKELLARVRAMTRRKTEYTQKDLTFNDVQLHSQTFELASENSVRLSVKEFELMQLLMLNKDRAVSIEYIMDQIWSREPDVQPDTVWLYISYLKRKLKAIASETEITGERHCARCSTQRSTRARSRFSVCATSPWFIRTRVTATRSPLTSTRLTRTAPSLTPRKPSSKAANTAGWATIATP